MYIHIKEKPCSECSAHDTLSHFEHSEYDSFSNSAKFGTIGIQGLNNEVFEEPFIGL